MAQTDAEAWVDIEVSARKMRHDLMVVGMMMEDDFIMSPEEVVAGIEGRAIARSRMGRERRFIGEVE